jgi:hypothetical protein
MSEPGESILLRVEEEETVILSAQPKVALAVLPDGCNDVAAGVCLFGVGDMRELAGAGVEAIQT